MPSIGILHRPIEKKPLNHFYVRGADASLYRGDARSLRICCSRPDSSGKELPRSRSRCTLPEYEAASSLDKMG